MPDHTPEPDNKAIISGAAELPLGELSLKETRTQVQPNGRLSADERIKYLQELRTCDFGSKLDNCACHEFFSRMGVAISASGFSVRTQELLNLPERDSERRSLSVAVYRSLLFELAQRLPEERRAPFILPNLTLRQQLNVLAEAAPNQRSLFIRGLVTLVINGRGEREFFQPQVPAVLHFMNVEERARLFNRVWLRPRTRYTGDTLSLILRSSRDLAELCEVTGQIRRSYLLSSKYPALREYLALAEIGRALREYFLPEVPGKRAASADIQRAAKAFLKNIDEREHICRCKPELSSTGAARRFLSALRKNRKLIKVELRSLKTPREKLELLGLVKRMMLIESRYPFSLSSGNQPGNSLVRWKSEELDQLEKYLAAFPEGLIAFSRTLSEIRRTEKDKDDKDELASFVSKDNLIYLHDYGVSDSNYRTIPHGLGHTAMNLGHETGHLITEGPHKRTRIISHRHRVMAELIRSELIGKDSADSAYIVDVLREAHSRAEVLRAIRSVGEETLIERADTALLNIMGRVVVGATLEKIEWPRPLPRCCSGVLVAKRQGELLQALLSHRSACQEEPAYAQSWFVRQQLRFSDDALAFLRRMDHEDLSLKRRREIVDLISAMARETSRRALSFDCTQSPLAESFDSWTLSAVSRLSRFLKKIDRSIASRVLFDPYLHISTLLEPSPAEGQPAVYNQQSGELRIYLGNQARQNGLGNQHFINDLKRQILGSQRPLRPAVNKQVMARTELMLGPTDNWMDFRGLTDLGGWEVVSRTRWRLMEKMGRSVRLDGVPRQADTPYVIDGKLKAFSYDESMLFLFDICEGAQNDTVWYNRQSPWEWAADQMVNYFLRPRYGIRWCPLVMDALEARFRCLPRDLLPHLDREVEKTRRRPKHLVLTQLLASIPRDEALEAVEKSLGPDLRDLIERYLALAPQEEIQRLLETNRSAPA